MVSREDENHSQIRTGALMMSRASLIDLVGELMLFDKAMGSKREGGESKTLFSLDTDFSESEARQTEQAINFLNKTGELVECLRVLNGKLK